MPIFYSQRQVRYRAALRPDKNHSLDSKHFGNLRPRITLGTVPQNPSTVTKPSIGPLYDKTPAGLIRHSIQLLPGLALHLQLHLRVLLEHLRVSSPETRRNCVTPLPRQLDQLCSQGVRAGEKLDQETPRERRSLAV